MQPSNALGHRLREANAGFWLSRALSTAVELGLVDHLRHSEVSLEELSDLALLDHRAVETLVRLLVHLGVAEYCHEGRLRLTADARALGEFEPNPFTTELVIDREVWDRFGALTDVLRERMPGGASDYFSELSREQRTGFDATMAIQIARAALEIAELLDFSCASRLLDLGGGTGVLAATFARRWPHLEVLVFDLAEVDDSPAEDGVEVQRGDFWRDRARQPFDLLVLSRVLHDWSDERALRLLRRWVAQLPIDGRVLVHEEMIGGSGDQGWPVMVDLFLVACLREGRVRTICENRQMLEAAGCEVVEVCAIAGGTTAIAAQRRR